MDGVRPKITLTSAGSGDLPAGRRVRATRPRQRRGEALQQRAFRRPGQIARPTGQATGRHIQAKQQPAQRRRAIKAHNYRALSCAIKQQEIANQYLNDGN
jgi:hypothetical protein